MLDLEPIKGLLAEYEAADSSWEMRVAACNVADYARALVAEVERLRARIAELEASEVGR